MKPKLLIIKIKAQKQKTDDSSDGEIVGQKKSVSSISKAADSTKT
jgi:hypothetical protein